MNITSSLLALVLLGASSVVFSATEAPAGIRPCCAFGTNLQTEVGGIPVPFVSVENVLELNALGEHVYNDGSQGVVSSLLGTGEENNGIFYTKKAGFLDSAHVRDTADFTYYLYGEFYLYLGTEHAILLSPELKDRIVQLTPSSMVFSDDERRAVSIELAALIAYRLAQWHEIAQWFGMESVSGFKEYASAFSPEDLYSNMLGAILASEVIAKSPGLNKTEFSKAMTQALNRKLIELGGVRKSESKAQVQKMDGVWWDSSKRLPNKWVVIHREYHLGTRLKPSGLIDGVEQQLSTQYEPLAVFMLLLNNHDDAFNALPATLLTLPYWTPEYFQLLADFAQRHDSNHITKGRGQSQ